MIAMGRVDGLIRYKREIKDVEGMERDGRTEEK